MTLEQVMELSAQGFNCAQIVYLSAAEQLGYDKEAALKTAACFGGGMFCGEVCGAVTGGLMAVGQKYGNCKPGDNDAKMMSKEKTHEFQQLFCEEYESLICRDILGYDFRDPQQAVEAKESGAMMEICPSVIAYATEILKEVL